MDREAAVGAVPSFLPIGKPCCAARQLRCVDDAGFLAQDTAPPDLLLLTLESKAPKFGFLPAVSMKEPAEDSSVVIRTLCWAHAPSCW